MVRIIFSGHLTDGDLATVAESLAEIEAAAEVSPDRLSDLTDVTSIALNFVAMELFAAKRRAAVLRNPVRSALVAPTQLQYGFARMFQTLNDHPEIEIQLFRDMDSGLHWITSPKGK